MTQKVRETIITKKDLGACAICGKPINLMTEWIPLKTRGQNFRGKKIWEHIVSSHGITEWAKYAKILGIPWPRLGGREEFSAGIVQSSGVVASTKRTQSEHEKWVATIAPRGPYGPCPERSGENNHFFGKKPWNAGKTKETDPSVASVSTLMTGRAVGEDTREKHRKNRASNPKKARHTTEHTEESKQKMREATAARHARGEFSHAKDTDIERFMGKWLPEIEKEIGFPLGITPQWLHRGFVFDFYLEPLNLVIETDGDFFHCNPAKFPNGSISEVQERNLRNDKRKNYVAKNSGLTLWRIWEKDIKSEGFKEKLCERLKSLVQPVSESKGQ